LTSGTPCAFFLCEAQEMVGQMARPNSNFQKYAKPALCHY
jgi:hypothetical protein